MNKDDLLSYLHCDLEEWIEKLQGKDCDRVTDAILEVLNIIEDNK